MSLRPKIAVFIGVTLLFSILTISLISIYSIRSKATADIEAFRQEEIRKAQLRLKNTVDLGYGILESAFDEGANDTSLAASLSILSRIRFDDGEGYFWITDTQLPYPTMIMHAAKPENAGKVMSDEKYNVVSGEEGKNLYQARVERSLADGDAFIDYFMVKPVRRRSTPSCPIPDSLNRFVGSFPPGFIRIRLKRQWQASGRRWMRSFLPLC